VRLMEKGLGLTRKNKKTEVGNHKYIAIYSDTVLTLDIMGSSCGKKCVGKQGGGRWSG